MFLIMLFLPCQVVVLVVVAFVFKRVKISKLWNIKTTALFLVICLTFFVGFNTITVSENYYFYLLLYLFNNIAKK